RGCEATHRPTRSIAPGLPDRLRPTLTGPSSSCYTGQLYQSAQKVSTGRAGQSPFTSLLGASRPPAPTPPPAPARPPPAPPPLTPPPPPPPCPLPPRR